MTKKEVLTMKTINDAVEKMNSQDVDLKIILTPKQYNENLSEKTGYLIAYNSNLQEKLDEAVSLIKMLNSTLTRTTDYIDSYVDSIADDIYSDLKEAKEFLNKLENK